MTQEAPSSDTQLLLERLVSGKPIDAEAYRRIRERAEQITDELRRKQGEMNIAVDLIREVRNEG